MSEADTIMSYLTLLAYLMGLTLILSIIYSIAEWFSKDRVVKIFEGKKVLVLIGGEVYCGKLYIPPRSGGGFEVFFESDKIENPLSLLAFLIENYKETGDEKFREEAEKLLAELKRKGVISQDIDLNDIELNPWSSPSLVSRKVYSSELKDLYAIIRFRDMLSENERKKIWKELRKLYHPPFFSRLKRKIYNALAYIKDRLTTILSPASLPMVSTVPEVKKAIEDLQKKAIAELGTLYDPLLENSIGRLITVKVKDIDNEEKIYQGILREYSNNYVAVYDVDYRLQVKAKYKGTTMLKNYPTLIHKIHGIAFKYSEKITIKSITCSKGKTSIVLENSSKRIIRVEKVRVEDKELSLEKVLKPDDTLTVIVEGEYEDPSIEIEYEVSREADIIWPKSKVKVIGLGDYPPTMLEMILSTV
ncbi:MAG: hypothetical protein DRJ38_00865 [Thermoprotei archaeon]|nr:MAG: hypothetical protein DRJ38_00865 [Thermoprotei archaeon]